MYQIASEDIARIIDKRACKKRFRFKYFTQYTISGHTAMIYVHDESSIEKFSSGN